MGKSVSSIEASVGPTDIGFLATRTADGYLVWDRGNKEYRTIRELPDGQDDSFIQHVKDVVSIAKKHGVLHAFSYAEKADRSYWAKVNSNMPMAGTRIL